MNERDRGRKVLGGQVPLRFVQIAVAQDTETGERLIGLAEDGSVWDYRRKSTRMEREVDGKRQAYYDHKYYWHPLRMSAEPGPESEERG